MPEELKAHSVTEVPFGDEPGWQFSYVKPDGTMLHHLMPKMIFGARAEQYGLDPEEDFDEVFDLVMHEAHGGPDAPDDDADPPQARGLMSAKAKPERKNKLGRRHARRAARAKQNVKLTGLDDLKEQIRGRKLDGFADFKDRLEVLETRRKIAKEVDASDKSA